MHGALRKYTIHAWIVKPSSKTRQDCNVSYSCIKSHRLYVNVTFSSLVCLLQCLFHWAIFSRQLLRKKQAEAKELGATLSLLGYLKPDLIPSISSLCAFSSTRKILISLCLNVYICWQKLLWGNMLIMRHCNWSISRGELNFVFEFVWKKMFAEIKAGKFCFCSLKLTLFSILLFESLAKQTGESFTLPLIYILCSICV